MQASLYASQCSRHFSKKLDVLRRLIDGDVSGKFLKEHITNTIDVVSKCCSDLLFNLDEFFSSHFESADVKHIIVNFGADPYRVLVLGNLDH